MILDPKPNFVHTDMLNNRWTNIPVDRIRETIEAEDNLCFYDATNKVWELFPSFILDDYYRDCKDIDAKHCNIVCTLAGRQMMNQHEVYILRSLHETWVNGMSHFLFSDKFRGLTANMLSEKNREKLIPSYTRIFNAYLRPLDDVKGVIINCSPINNEQATGFAFATENGQKNEELSLFIDTYRKSIGKGSLHIVQPHLEEIQDRGIILLNCALTSSKENRLAHIKVWADFMQAVIKTLNTRPKLSFLLLGTDAGNLVSHIDKKHDVFQMPLMNYYIVKKQPVPLGVFTSFFNQVSLT